MHYSLANFDGSLKPRRQAAARPGAVMGRAELLERARRERERRKQGRLQNASALVIQSAWRAHASRRRAREAARGAYAPPRSASLALLSPREGSLRSLLFFFDPSDADDVIRLAEMARGVLAELRVGRGRAGEEAPEGLGTDPLSSSASRSPWPVRRLRAAALAGACVEALLFDGPAEAARRLAAPRRGAAAEVARPERGGPAAGEVAQSERGGPAAGEVTGPERGGCAAAPRGAGTGFLSSSFPSGLLAELILELVDPAAWAVAEESENARAVGAAGLGAPSPSSAPPKPGAESQAVARAALEGVESRVGPRAWLALSYALAAGGQGARGGAGEAGANAGASAGAGPPSSAAGPSLASALVGTLAARALAVREARGDGADAPDRAASGADGGDDAPAASSSSAPSSPLLRLFAPAPVPPFALRAAEAGLVAWASSGAAQRCPALAALAARLAPRAALCVATGESAVAGRTAGGAGRGVASALLGGSGRRGGSASRPGVSGGGWPCEGPPGAGGAARADPSASPLAFAAFASPLQLARALLLAAPAATAAGEKAVASLSAGQRAALEAWAGRADAGGDGSGDWGRGGGAAAASAAAAAAAAAARPPPGFASAAVALRSAEAWFSAGAVACAVGALLEEGERGRRRARARAARTEGVAREAAGASGSAAGPGTRPPSAREPEGSSAGSEGDSDASSSSESETELDPGEAGGFGGREARARAALGSAAGGDAREGALGGGSATSAAAAAGSSLPDALLDLVAEPTTIRALAADAFARLARGEAQRGAPGSVLSLGEARRGAPGGGLSLGEAQKGAPGGGLSLGEAQKGAPGGVPFAEGVSGVSPEGLAPVDRFASVLERIFLVPSPSGSPAAVRRAVVCAALASARLRGAADGAPPPSDASPFPPPPASGLAFALWASTLSSHRLESNAPSYFLRARAPAPLRRLAVFASLWAEDLETRGGAALAEPWAAGAVPALVVAGEALLWERKALRGARRGSGAAPAGAAGGRGAAGGAPLPFASSASASSSLSLRHLSEPIARCLRALSEASFEAPAALAPDALASPRLGGGVAAEALGGAEAVVDLDGGVSAPRASARRAWRALARAPCLVPFEERAAVVVGALKQSRENAHARAVAERARAAVERERRAAERAHRGWDEGGGAFGDVLGLLAGGGRGAEGEPAPGAAAPTWKPLELRVRRGREFRDALPALAAAPPAALAARPKVEYFSSQGMAEAGIDGGGLAREFLFAAIEQMVGKGQQQQQQQEEGEREQGGGGGAGARGDGSRRGEGAGATGEESPRRGESPSSFEGARSLGVSSVTARLASGLASVRRAVGAGGSGSRTGAGAGAGARGAFGAFGAAAPMEVDGFGGLAASSSASGSGTSAASPASGSSASAWLPPLVPTPGGDSLRVSPLASLEEALAAGRLLGMALLEGARVDVPLTRSLLRALKGLRPRFRDLASFDPELYRNLCWLRADPSRARGLGLVFEIDPLFPRGADAGVGGSATAAHDASAPGGAGRGAGPAGGLARAAGPAAAPGASPAPLELIPGGGSVAVSPARAVEYSLLAADARLRREGLAQTRAFVRGALSLVPRRLLGAFSDDELRRLVCGARGGFDVRELARHAVVVAQTEDDARAADDLFAVLETLEPADKALFLRFVTASPNPPLLGFASLSPPFTIHVVHDAWAAGGRRTAGRTAASAPPAAGRAPLVAPASPPEPEGATRLPTAATCANLLKLPLYGSRQELARKLTYAIRAGQGFELS